MGFALGADILKIPTRVSGTQISIPAGTRITIGGQQYFASSILLINTGTVGASGIDTGAIGVNQLWFVHFVISGGVLAAIASQSKTAVTGFSKFGWSGSAFMTNGSSQIATVGNTKNLKKVTILTSGSGNFTLNPFTVALDMEMVGAGGGGAPASGGSGTAGTATTFGTGYLSAGGGGGASSTDGGIPGVYAALPAGFIGFGVNGNGGGSGYQTGPTQSGYTNSGTGAPGPWGGAGRSRSYSNAGVNAEANSGAGGSGGNPGLSNNAISGGGGGSGAYIKGRITDPLSSYPYSIGVAGTGSGNGSDGLIVIEESFEVV